MLKGLGILIGGIFVGAVGMEVARQKYPDAPDKVYAKMRQIASGLKAAFKEGYQRATKPQEAAGEGV